MTVSAIDVHHHYVPASLLEEAKKNGRHLGVELAEKRPKGDTTTSAAASAAASAPAEAR